MTMMRKMILLRHEDLFEKLKIDLKLDGSSTLKKKEILKGQYTMELSDLRFLISTTPMITKTMRLNNKLMKKKVKPDKRLGINTKKKKKRLKKQINQQKRKKKKKLIKLKPLKKKMQRLKLMQPRHWKNKIKQMLPRLNSRKDKKKKAKG